jgi:hypothetical protein
MPTPAFAPSPHRPLDPGARTGAEVWRVVDAVVFHHWDRWLLRLALDEPQGMDGLRESFLRRARFRDQELSFEAMLAQIVDLQRRMGGLGLAPHDLLDEQERTSEWLRQKAHKRVLEDGPHTRTEAMGRTPRRVLEERGWRGFWPHFPVSPARFEAELRHPLNYREIEEKYVCQG